MSEWIAVPTLEAVGEYPDFRVYGFHTEKRVIVRRRDGSEQETFYNGYGMFGQDDFMDVTHWRPSPNAKIEGSPLVGDPSRMEGSA